MRESEKNELIDRLGRIDEAICNAKYSIQHGDEPCGIQDAMFQFGVAKAFIIRLREDIRNTEADPEEDAPELPAQAPAAEDAGNTLSGTGGWVKYRVSPGDEAGTDGAEQKTEDTEDVILPKEEEQTVSAGARIKVSSLPEVSVLPPTKEVRVPDEELPKPRRRGGRPKKKFTLDEDPPDPLE